MFAVLTYLLMTVEVIVCLLLISVILIQKTKGQGIGLAFGSSMGETLFGAQVGNVLTRTTVILAVIFLANTAMLAYLGAARGRSSSVTDEIPVAPVSTTMPAAPGTASELPVSGGMPMDMPSGSLDLPAPVPSESAGEAGAPVEVDMDASGALPAPSVDMGDDAMPAPAAE